MIRRARNVHAPSSGVIAVIVNVIIHGGSGGTVTLIRPVVLAARPALIPLLRVVRVQDGVCGRDVDLHVHVRGQICPVRVPPATRYVTIEVGAGAGLEILVLVLVLISVRVLVLVLALVLAMVRVKWRD